MAVGAGMRFSGGHLARLLDVGVACWAREGGENWSVVMVDSGVLLRCVN